MRLLLALLLCLGNLGVQAAEHGVNVISSGRLPLQGGQLALGLSQDWRQPLPGVQRVLIIVHGRLRNAQTYLSSGEKAADRAGQRAATLVIAPQFLNQSDIARHSLPDALLRWKGNAWMAGEPAASPIAISSYTVLDAILQRLQDRALFPALKAVVIAGHSGGAQAVQRYAVATGQHPELEKLGISLRFVIANPSSYTYFDATRPVPSAAQNCPGFNDWKYGLNRLPPYAAGRPPAQLERGYVTRHITYLLGQQDIDPHHPALDKSCAAEAQGAYRLIRGHHYFDYLKRRHPHGLRQRLVEVPGVGHDGDRMFTSPEGQAALFQ